VGILAAAPGDTRAEYDGVASLYLPIAIVVFAIVSGAVLFALVRYRARPGRAPRPTHERHAVELALAGLVAAVVALLVATTFAAESRIEDTGPRGDLRVEVTAFRWGWRFSYPDLGGIAIVGQAGRPPVLRVPAGAHVDFDVTSRDVIHSFWIPELRFKRQAFPRRHEHFDLRFPDETTFMGGACGFFCGLEHSDMRFSVAVMSYASFRRWVSEQRSRT
jgi:cytochrome c oxidase subunit II